MSITLKGFFRCPCGKLHAHGGITSTSRCPECGRELLHVMLTWDRVNSPRTIAEERQALTNG